MNNNLLSFRSSVLLIVAAITCQAGELAAQNQHSGLALEEVVVTAQKREQLLQDVPIAVSAYSGEELIEAGVIDVSDLTEVNPSLVVTTSTNESEGASLRIRGVGTAGNNPGLEGSVGVFVDGVYLSRTGMAMTNLVDIQRVEVLRGPQGTLFGKNTSSGALAIFTRRPEFDFGAMLDLSYGNYNAILAKGMVTGTLMEDTLAGRLTFYSQTRDGQVEDVNTGAEYNNRDRWALRGQLLSVLHDDISLRIIGDYSKKDEDCCNAPYSEYGPKQADVVSLGGTTASLDPFDRKVAVNEKSTNSTEEYGVSAELDWALNDMDLISISSARKYKYDINNDADFSNLDLINGTNSTEVETIAQELRLQGNYEIVDWVLGAYLFREDISENSSQLYGSQIGDYFATFVASPALQETIRDSYVEGEGALLNDFDQHTRGWSVFTHNNIAITDALNLTLGLRYNVEEKDGGGKFTTQSTPLCEAAGGISALGIMCPRPDFNSNNEYDEVTGTAKLSYFFAENSMVYGGYSRGFKAGGINLDRNAGLSEFEFLPEKVDSWEIGTKSEFLNHRLRVNTSIYYSEFDDYQLNSYDGTSFSITNAAGVKSRGVEVDVMAGIMRGLIVGAAYGYNDSKYTNDTIDPQLAGETLNNAPKSVFTTSLVYRRPLGDSGLAGFFNANARYQTGTNTGSDLDPAKHQSSFTVVNARLGVRSEANGWEVALWGKNIFDADNYLIVINSPAQAGSYNAFVGAPATYGISAKINI